MGSAAGASAATCFQSRVNALQCPPSMTSSNAEIIYLDNNATTQLDPAVIEEMMPFLTTYYGNPSSGYGFGSQVRDAIEQARERVAVLIGCVPAEIIFTSCGTESNNTAINSAL